MLSTSTELVSEVFTLRPVVVSPEINMVTTGQQDMVSANLWGRFPVANVTNDKSV